MYQWQESWLYLHKSLVPYMALVDSMANNCSRCCSHSLFGAANQTHVKKKKETVADQIFFALLLSDEPVWKFVLRDIVMEEIGLDLNTP